MKRVFQFTVNGKNLLFFGTIKGLVSERKKLRELFENFQAEVLFVGISPEQLEGLKKYINEPFEIEPEDYEVIYALKLEKYGEVGLPVPTYLEAFSIAKKENIELLALDIPEKEYSDLFVKTIDIFHIFHYNFRKRKVWRKKFNAESPEDFVIMWDREINKIKPYYKIELKREEYMGNKIKELISIRSESRIMIVIELERLYGVLKNLNLLQTT
ncbi:hypothetical protein B6U71_00595 [Euryarchaeota archaeon ex4484_178]|nr:MAG: hypothetical protein B6U71_00595 [Euryarchaeota archaeon ex4484_178]